MNVFVVVSLYVGNDGFEHEMFVGVARNEECAQKICMNNWTDWKQDGMEPTANRDTPRITIARLMESDKSDDVYVRHGYTVLQEYTPYVERSDYNDYGNYHIAEVEVEE